MNQFSDKYIFRCDIPPYHRMHDSIYTDFITKHQTTLLVVTLFQYIIMKAFVITSALAVGLVLAAPAANPNALASRNVACSSSMLIISYNI